MKSVISERWMMIWRRNRNGQYIDLRFISGINTHWVDEEADISNEEIREE